MAGKRPSFTSMETVCCIARLGTFGAAAEALGTTQPAISARIKDLEDTLGTRLFTARGRRVVLTVHGREFVQRAEILLGQMEELVGSVADPHAASGLVRLGAGHAALSWIPKMIATTRQLMPNLRYELVIDLAVKIQQHLEAGRVDLAIVPGQITNHQLDSIELGYADMVWMASTPVADGGNMAEFFDAQHIWSVPSASFMNAMVLEDLERIGASAANISYCDNVMATIDMVVGGSGIALLPEALVDDQLSSGRLFPIPGMPKRPLTFSVAWYAGPQQHIVARMVEAAVQHSTFRRDR